MLYYVLYCTQKVRKTRAIRIEGADLPLGLLGLDERGLEEGEVRALGLHELVVGLSGHAVGFRAQLCDEQ